MKTLLTLIALTLIFFIGRHLWRQRQRQQQADRKTSTPAQLTVRCAHCGLYLPSQEAISHQGRSYCCPAHRDVGPLDR